MIFGATLSQLLSFLQTTIIYGKTTNDSDRGKLQINLDSLGDGRQKINPSKSKSLSFTRARVKVSLNYFFGGTKKLRKPSVANVWE
jgi:hypothetical protein